jgi:hypothetical protein
VPKPADRLDVLVTVGLLLAAVGLLITALGTGHAGLAWGSVALSALAAALILRRWRRSWVQHQDAPEVPSSEAVPSWASAEQDAQSGEAQPGEAQPGEAEPAEEDTDAADLLVVYELMDEVLVVDEHPRYHLPRCRWPDRARAERLPVREARELGFTPCGRCRPDTTLARKHRLPRTTTAGSS